MNRSACTDKYNEFVIDMWVTGFIMLLMISYGLEFALRNQTTEKLAIYIAIRVYFTTIQMIKF